jgi:hypothetical protein
MQVIWLRVHLTLYISKDYGVNHGPKTFHHILIESIINVRGEVNLGVEFTDRANNELLLGLLIFFLDPLVILCSKLGHVFESLLDVVLVLLEISVLQRVCPVDFVEVKKHLLLELVLTIVHSD